MWFGFQFNLSDSSDDDLYRLYLDPEGQGHQWKMISMKLGSYFGAPKKKLSRGCLRVRPDANADANADANRSKTICRPESTHRISTKLETLALDAKNTPSLA